MTSYSYYEFCIAIMNSWTLDPGSKSSWMFIITIKNGSKAWLSYWSIVIYILVKSLRKKYLRSRCSFNVKVHLHWDLKACAMRLWLENSDCLLVDWDSRWIGNRNFPITVMSCAVKSPNVNPYLNESHW